MVIDEHSSLSNLITKENEKATNCFYEILYMPQPDFPKLFAKRTVTA